MKLTFEGIKDTAAWQSAGVKLPEYDVQAAAEKAKAHPVWAHFGAGNIFRIFVGGLADTLIAKGEMDRGITCVETFDFDVVDQIYAPYDNLVLAVTLNADATTDKRVLGSLSEAIKAQSGVPEAWSRLKAVFADPSLQMVSFTITEKGYGKRTPVEEYRITNRGGLGIKNYQITDKTGKIVGVKVVDGTEDLLLMTQSGILIRTPVENIKETANRATQGVIVMRFKEEGDQVISMALAEHEDTEEAEVSAEISANEENSTTET